VDILGEKTQVDRHLSPTAGKIWPSHILQQFSNTDAIITLVSNCSAENYKQQNEMIPKQPKTNQDKSSGKPTILNQQQTYAQATTDKQGS